MSKSHAPKKAVSSVNRDVNSKIHRWTSAENKFKKTYLYPPGDYGKPRKWYVIDHKVILK